MSEFVERPASKNSIANRKPVFGAGTNDAVYLTRVQSTGGITLICPYYIRWNSMLRRCYSEIYHEKYPTYIGCTVAPEWLTFSNFKAWMEKQDWKGMQLDKDVLHPGNRIYSPEYCIFIPQQLNKLLNDSGSNRGRYPVGVCFHKATSKFIAQCNINGERKHLGCFKTPEHASLAYRRFKSALIVEAAEQYPELKEALLVHADLYLRGEIQ